MKTVGEILKETREKKGLKLSDIEKTTKIKERVLELLEKNEFSKIAEGTIVKGFIKNYAECLDLSSRDVLAIFRRDFIEDKEGQIVPRGIYEPLNQPKIIWTPRATIIAALVILFLSLAVYLFIQFFGLLGRPSLEVSRPQDGEVIKIDKVKIVGKTSPDSLVLVNNEMVLVSADGSFEKTISLLPGENKIKIEAISRRSKKTTISRTVSFAP